MVKAFNVVLGFIIFSLVLSMFFAAIAETMALNNVEGAETFAALSGQYEGFSTQEQLPNSTTRQILDGTKIGTATSEETTNFLVSGSLSGGRLSLNFFKGFDDIITITTTNANTGESYIDSRIIKGILVILTVLSAFILLHFLRGAKTET